MKTKLIFITGVILLISGASKAQDGSLDFSFDPGTGANNIIYATSIQNDGKIIIAGYFTDYNGTARNHIARINTNGSHDHNFEPGSGANQVIQTTAIQSDGKVIVTGWFTTFNGTSRIGIARLNTNGNLDNSFDPGTGSNNHILTTLIQSDGRILIGGRFTSYNGTARSGIARLNTDGSLDTSFDPGTGANGWVESISIQSNGNIIIGGNFMTYNGTARRGVARLNSNGSLDTSFNPGLGANDKVLTTSVQNDGKIIIGGNFTSYNGSARNRIARLNVDGSLDSSFNVGSGANGVILSSTLLSDGKIIIGGTFTTYNGISRNNIARLSSVGSLDTYFEPGTGAESTVYSTSVQSDGKIIIAGNFSTYDGIPRNRIARIENSLSIGINDVGKEVKNAYVFPNPLVNSGILHSNVELKNATSTIFNLSGQSLMQIENIYGHSINLDRESLPAGLYFIQLLQDDRMIMCDKLVIAN